MIADNKNNVIYYRYAPVDPELSCLCLAGSHYSTFHFQLY